MKFIKYLNKSKRSGVSSYQLGRDWIIVNFINGTSYLYNKQKPGGRQIYLMHKLAKDGRGLNRFIVKHVNDMYFKKLK